MMKNILKSIFQVLGYTIQALFYAGLYAIQSGKVCFSNVRSGLLRFVKQKTCNVASTPIRPIKRHVSRQKKSHPVLAFLAAMGLFAFIALLTSNILDLTLSKLLDMILPAFAVAGINLGATMLVTKGVFEVLSKETRMAFPCGKLMKLTWFLIGLYTAFQVYDSNPKRFYILAAVVVGGFLYRLLWRPIETVLEKALASPVSPSSSEIA